MNNRGDERPRRGPADRDVCRRAFVAFFLGNELAAATAGAPICSAGAAGRASSKLLALYRSALA
jgi:hypothetical protein